MHEEAHRCFDASSSIFRGLGLRHEVAQIEEMKRNAEHWIMRSVGVDPEKEKSSVFSDQRILMRSRRLKP